MIVQKILPKHCNRIQKEILNLFHSSNLPMHFNRTGNKEFTNYQRISIIILYFRSKKSLRDFILEFRESKWINWLGLKRNPSKSGLHNWIKLFDMKIIRKIHQITVPNEVILTSIDGTGFDSWQRSRHYEKRVGEISLPHMPYAKSDLFIDVKTQMILDFNIITHREHDVIGAERIFKRNKIKNIIGLGDRGYDSEHLHEVARENGITFYARVRKMNKRGFSYKKPSGKHRKECLELPDFIGMRSINETVNSVLKRTQISYLKSKKSYFKQREFAWHVILYNLKRKIIISSEEEIQTFFYLEVIICPIWTEPINLNFRIVNLSRNL
jgi:hypothetical protein